MQIDVIALVEQHAKRCGLTPRDLLVHAGLDQSTWSRWRNSNRSPMVVTLNKVLAVDPKRIYRQG